jgi:twinkle protein
MKSSGKLASSPEANDPATSRRPVLGARIVERKNGTLVCRLRSVRVAFGGVATTETAIFQAENSTMTPTLGRTAVQAFEGRGISAETAARFGIYTGKTVQTAGPEPRSDVVPDAEGNVVVFPFFERSVVVAEKYRAPGKRFWQRPGGRRTFWNADALDDPSLATGHLPLIITEGEIDALTAVDCGFPLAVSVPDGAPTVPTGERPDELRPLDPGTEREGKFEFLFNNRERLRPVKRFILAVDNDLPGQRLAAELVRRLSASRCSFVEYPQGCKDLNDVRQKHGAEGVAAVLNGARPYPVKGLYKLTDYPDLPPRETYRTPWHSLDEHLRFFAGEFMVVTGIPNHGKSPFVFNMLIGLAQDHGWPAAIFSPETPVMPALRDKIRRMLLGRPHEEASKTEVAQADAWIGRYFTFIDPEPIGDGHDEDFDLDWIIDRAKDAVLRNGIRILVIDPWNEIEHARHRDETVTDYIARSIRALKRFARQHDVAVIVVAHPTKEVGKDGKGRPPTLYDIEGSAAWYNKCDHGVVVHRFDETTSETTIRIAKCKWQETGRKGLVNFRFDVRSEWFRTLDHAGSGGVTFIKAASEDDFGAAGGGR